VDIIAKRRQKLERRAKLRRVIKITLLVCAVLAFLLAMWLVPRYTGPNIRSQNKQQEIISVSEEMLDVLAQSQRFERIYRAAIEVGDPSVEDLRTLDKAIELQHQYIDGTPPSQEMQQRLTELLTLKQDALAKELVNKSRDEEDKGAVLEQRREYVKARSHLRIAIDLQERINTEYPLSQYRSIPRIAQLKRNMQVLIARPIQEESFESEEKAKQAVEQEDWKTALEQYRHAAKLQRQLNIDYVQLRFSDMGRSQKLDTEIASLESVDLHMKINELSKKGDEALKSGSIRQGAEYFQEALETQKELNRTFPQSRFADTARVETLTAKEQIARSSPLAEEIKQAAGQIRASLAKRDAKSVRGALEILYPKLASFKDNFPHSNLVDERLFFEINFLHAKRGQIEQLQQLLDNGLIALPSGVKMLKTEVWQDLFMEIVGTNPSRNRGGRLPVETVNYPEAADFCRRAGYLLGTTVRLPTPEEFKEALGSLRYVDLHAVCWNSENSGASTHPVGEKQPNQAGFNDLLGNVAEWTQAADTDKSAAVMGGSFMTPVDQIGDISIVQTVKNERNRLNGLRIVVEAQ